MGDPKMVNGLQNVENVIRVGFLNSKVLLQSRIMSMVGMYPIDAGTIYNT